MLEEDNAINPDESVAIDTAPAPHVEVDAGTPAPLAVAEKADEKANIAQEDTARLSREIYEEVRNVHTRLDGIDSRLNEHGQHLTGLMARPVSRGQEGIEETPPANESEEGVNLVVEDAAKGGAKIENATTKRRKGLRRGKR